MRNMAYSAWLGDEWGHACKGALELYIITSLSQRTLYVPQEDCQFSRRHEWVGVHGTHYQTHSWFTYNTAFEIGKPIPFLVKMLARFIEIIWIEQSCFQQVKGNRSGILYHFKRNASEDIRLNLLKSSQYRGAQNTKQGCPFCQGPSLGSKFLRFRGLQWWVQK